MKNILILCTFFCFFSCEKELNLDAEFKTNKLVVYSFFSSNEVWEVEVSKSLNILEEKEFELVKNANVEIQDENGDLIESLIFQDSTYVSALGTKPILGKKYKLRVSAPNFESVTSEGECADNVPIISLDSTSSIGGRWGDRNYKCSIKFQDVAGKENYYALILKHNRTEIDSNFRTVDTTIYQYEQSLSSNDGFVDNTGLYFSAITFKDKFFDGQQKTLNFNFSLFQSNSRKVIYDNKLQFVSLTKESYNYLTSSNLFFENEDDPFANPVQVFDNIENGFGLFGGQSIYEIDM